MGGGESAGWAINNKGQTVGYYSTLSGDIHPFLYNNGVTYDLNNLNIVGFDNRMAATTITHPGDAAETVERYVAGLDINDNGTLDEASDDRITDTYTVYVYQNDNWYLKTEQIVFPTGGNTDTVVVQTTLQQLTGLGAAGKAWETIITDIHGNQTVSQIFLDPAAKTETRITNDPDSDTDTVTVITNGLTVSVTDKVGITTQYQYDGLERRIMSTDPRTGASDIHYDAHGRIDYTEDAANNRTQYQYDSQTGHLTVETNPDNKATRYAYNDRGELTHKWGGAVEPVEYVYDAAGTRTLSVTPPTSSISTIPLPKTAATMLLPIPMTTTAT